MGVTIQGLLQEHLDALTASRRLSRDMWNAAIRLRGCRTAEMGVHIKRCPDNHVSSIAYNSCRHRSCQICSGLERQRWLERWQTRLLPCPHHHVVFTIPHELLDLWRYNKIAMTNILFAAASQALRELLEDPKYCGGRVGLLAGLHTWSQTLAAHVHLHVLVTAGGLGAEQRWRSAVKNCLLPRKVLMIVFRGKFREFTLQALQQGKLELPPATTDNQWISQLNRLGRVAWNVKVFDRYQHGQGVARYLARYLRGGPIGNSRLLGLRDGKLNFRYRVPSQKAGDRTRQATMVMSVLEFLRRFLEHVPPRGMQTVRGYGLYAGNQHSRLLEAFEALGSEPPDLSSAPTTVAELLERMGLDTSSSCCPVCGKALIVIERHARPYWRSARSPPSSSSTSHSNFRQPA